MDELKDLDPVVRDFLISMLSSIRLQLDNIIDCLKLEDVKE